MTARGLIAAFAVPLALLLGTAPALALDFHITPLVIHVRPGTNAQTITVQNTSLMPLRIQVRAYAWTQVANAAEHLEPTEDVVFFPSLLTIGPGDSRAVRVGMMKAVAASATERTYRVMLQELPSLETALAPNSASIAVRLQLSVPIYVDPMRPVSKPSLETAEVRGSAVRFTLANAGNVHYRVDKLAVAAYDAHGAAVFTEELNSPVILANGSHHFDVALDPSKCGKVHEVTITAQTDGGSLKRSVAASPDSCR